MFESDALCDTCAQPRAEHVTECAPVPSEAAERRILSLKPGSLVAEEQYKVVRMLGEGGFAFVYLAVHWETGARVALKEFFPDEGVNRGKDGLRVTPNNSTEFAEQLGKFFNEAERGKALPPHENLMPVLDIVQDHGTAYIVMPYEDGRDAEAWCEEQAKAGKRVPVKEAVGLALDVLTALHVIDGTRHLVHQDVKPRNVYVRKGENKPARLMDFGAARLEVGPGGSETATRFRSEGYAAPEQYVEKYSKEGVKEGDRLGPWTDVYGVGATLWRLLSGKQPTASVLRARSPEKMRPLAVECGERVSAELSAVVDMALRLDPTQRYKSAAAMHLALLTACPGVGRSRLPRRSAVEVLPAEMLDAMYLAQDPGSFVPSSDRIEMICVKAGTLRRGERGGSVRLSRPFALGAVPLTWTVWEAITGLDRPDDAKPDHPVVGVSWLEAVQFCNALSAIAGRTPVYAGVDDGTVSWDRRANGYRLPTEAEWEYACQAQRNAGAGGADGGQTRAPKADDTRPVGEGGANPWGLHDMIGNVAEWCWDWAAPYPDRAVVDWAGPEQAQQQQGMPHRIVRGGSQRFPGQRVTSESRRYHEPGNGAASIGLRLARTVS
ncbi:MAG: hypothetical protein AMXMBFR64_54520 [Myxococcales bacterium]